MSKRELEDPAADEAAKQAKTDEAEAAPPAEPVAAAEAAPPAEEAAAPPPAEEAAAPPVLDASAIAAAAAAAAAAIAAPPPQPLATGTETLAQIVAANPALLDGPATMLAVAFADSDVHFKLELHADAVVAIFGYDGLTINTIRERTGCRMKLLSAGSDPDTRVLEMGGGQDGALNAIGLILAEMQKSCGANPNVCTPSAAGPTYIVKLLVRSDACGSIIGKGGAIIAQMRQMSGAMIKIETAEGNSHDQAQAAASAGMSAPPDRTIIFTGLITAVHSAMIDVVPRISQFLKQARAKGFIGFGGAPGAPPGGGQPMVPGGAHPLEQGPGYVHPVPSTIVGKVIGPGGVTIREIRDKTGARVRVANDKIDGTNDRPLTIWGTETQVQMVLQMVAEIIARPDDRPPRQPKPQGAAPAYGYAPPAYGAPPPAYGAPPPAYGQYAPPPAQYGAYAPPPGQAYGAPPPPPPPPGGGYAPPPGGYAPPPAAAPAADPYAAYYAQYGQPAPAPAPAADGYGAPPQYQYPPPQ